MRSVMILNPNAGSAESISALEKRLGDEPDCEVLTTTSAGHASQIAREAIERRIQRLIAAGGDGTINEIINGLAPDFGDIELAIVPLGTGNDLTRTLCIPREPIEALELAIGGDAAPIDVCRIRGAQQRYFLNMSAGGFSGLIDAYMNDENKERWGSLAYLASAVSALRDVTTYELELTVDNHRVAMNAYNVVVANGRYAGGGIPVAPEAMLDDGMMELMVLPATPLAEAAIAALDIVRGRQHASERVLTLRGRSIEVQSEPDMPFNVDGELLGECDAHFDLLPLALRVVVGPECEGVRASAKRVDSAA